MPPPVMKVVRSASPGMLSRSLASSALVCAWGGRFMASSVRLLMCCSGMSMYLHTCGDQVKDQSQIQGQQAGSNVTHRRRHTRFHNFTE